MRVPNELSTFFGENFEELISTFTAECGLLPEASAIRSKRFLARSVIPHAKRLSVLFNRQKDDTHEASFTKEAVGLAPYWKDGSNPTNLRLSYFLYFMPSNLYRIASVWAELARLGFRWKAEGSLRALDLGSGPAAGACGIAAGERICGIGIPAQGNWALIEQDKSMLELGSRWADCYFRFLREGFESPDWQTRTFHRKLDLKTGFLPKTAPKFHLWISSFFLNELNESPCEIARELLSSWEKHLEEEGLAILIEPALKLQSRKLLEIRRELLSEAKSRKLDWLKVLLPCLGGQSCGALADPEDWCHEEVLWWRPPYFKRIDEMVKLDRKSLNFSYLVIAKSHRSLTELLPNVGSKTSTERLVSPAFAVGKDLEFYICGQEGKRRVRSNTDDELERGDVLQIVEWNARERGRIKKFSKV